MEGISHSSGSVGTAWGRTESTELHVEFHLFPFFFYNNMLSLKIFYVQILFIIAILIQNKFMVPPFSVDCQGPLDVSESRQSFESK